ncbi:FAD/NAD(P)-binding domain-containing protein [Aspergillus steynii IBT 23096]|uniref:FAD/NAD(P)-binding domain-containing protein n=1 Tax=Aspergillus steynii IBT 23096 TaxID=1392250 RepID=A0A2I2GLV7_9EURO|nr:FAD/NAD(P)-binding domain-containing protein [Aspergillus steynii IBT 23096]PLB53855.1 FAD/NAD(P)-binding domain-containing protein [Aspergillus steynii IBT 23096]
MANERLSGIFSHLKPTIYTSDAEPRDNAPRSEYKILEQPLGSTRPLRIIGIGAGASGLNMIRTLRKHLTDYEHVVYEKNPAIGGTWYENRYPGCACDVPSHNYQFSWRPNPEWTSFFSPSAEIQQYLASLCEEESMSPAIKLEHRVVGVQWDDDRGVWNVKVENMQSGEIIDDYCHFLLDGSGILNNWKWPEIPGLFEFRGELVHSANWADDFKYEGKKVAVIGNGSSGVQIVPAMQPSVHHLFHFIRSPTWLSPSRRDIMGSELENIQIDSNGKFTPQQIEKFRSDPVLYRRFVKAMEVRVNGNFPIVINGSPVSEMANQVLQDHMRNALKNDEQLCKALIPSFPVGCRRLTPGVGYLPSLTEANVTVVTDRIERVVQQGVQLSNGEIIEVDAIVCASGFDVSFRPRFPIIGKTGNLQDLWSQQLPEAYMSCAVPGFPNYFMFLGPGAPIGHGSVFTISEHIAKYVTRVIIKCQTERIRAITVSKSATAEFNEHLQTFMPKTVYTGSCRSWYKNNTVDGPVIALHPGSRIHFFHMLQELRGEDWEYDYLDRSPNRFAYLGNGFSTKELGDQDSTWYLDSPDDL